VVVVAPPELEGTVRGSGLAKNDRFVALPEAEDGYIGQQCVKLHAHNLTDADYICFVDSDCLARRHFMPESFFVGSRPHFLYTPYDTLIGSGAERWQVGTEHVVREKVLYEFMRRHPAFYPRDVLFRFDEWVQHTHGHAASQFMRLHGRSLCLSEFNLLGAWSWVHCHDRFTWLNTLTDSFPPDFVEQLWSWGGPDHPSNAARYKAVAL
jgi:hypothetical protein